MKNVSNSIRVAHLVAALAAASGCTSLESGAKEAFSQAHSCPEDRVTVTERKDVDVYEATFGPAADPPPEIKADPERLAMWKKDEAEKHARYNTNREVFQVRGCDHDELFSCFHPDAPDSGGTNYAQAACSKLAHPPGTRTLSPSAKQ